MFFALSKLLWIVINPGSLLVLALVAAALLSFGKWRKTAAWIIRLCAAAALVVAVVPVGAILHQHLEARFPTTPQLPPDITGIVILGGVINPRLSAKRGRTQINESAERLTVGAKLAQRFPNAKVIFTGGSGDLFNPNDREAHFAAPLFLQLGLAKDRVMYEDKARNTIENAIFAKEIANPVPGEHWILVTSAFHMPRAVGVFRKAGWPVIPFPVDFTDDDETPGLTFDLVGGLGALSASLHEFMGLSAYWITGKTDTLYPAPNR